MKRKPTTLAEYLKANRITQADFGKRVGVAQPVISRIVRGARAPRLSLALRIAALAKIPVESLVDNDGVSA